ncbi:ATP-binding protein [Runella slithyformis]|uniref:histidine kinase n=1 Tax=Runella slithyformis (strain ATCC 29530 / DSM 19594 / LMG 11500 / NCIMB 11436 / LSU 4) TaxID=761193 RepID=A0A7U3ZKE4_RUNSL|nr:histidine kinase [Runella slithyformis]AEI48840.1 putative signal transduction histidine kinase [Runella slithyformis DSM 19594]
MPLRIPKRFTRLYITALSLVAFLTILGQILVQNTLNDGLNDSWLVNFAGRQRFLSQVIAKNALLFTQRPDSAAQNTQLKEFKEVLTDWESHHDQLRTGNLRDISATYVNSDTVKTMFLEIEPHFQAIRQNAHLILQWMEKPGDSLAVNASVRTIFAHELAFLHKMNQIVFRYDKEAKEKVTRLRRIELWLMALTLVILLLEGVFIFRPAVRKLRETIVQLMDAREQTMTANRELQGAYQQLRHTQAQLLEATQMRHQQEIKEHKIRASALLQGQEEERKRLSKEMHDGVGQMLTGLKLIAENFGGTNDWNPRDLRNMQDLRTVIGQTIQEVRTISHNLMPTVLNDFGIDLALKQLVDSTARNTNAHITFTSNLKEKRLDRNVEIGLYRIAQEAINNAVKHAEATQISLEVSLINKRIALRIKDNGKGFNVTGKKSKANVSPTNGLRNLHERAHLLDGTLKINSAIGRGTEIIAQIPHS